MARLTRGAVARYRAIVTPVPIEVTPADRRTVEILGLVLPVRATIALLAVSLLVLLDHHGRIAPFPFDGLPALEAARARALSRLVGFGGTALLLLVLFRDHPRRYGLTLGDARAGLPIAIGACLALTPLYVAIAGMEDFRAYYAPLAADPGTVIATAALELVASEWLYRGVLTFALVRTIGPLGVVVAVLPFAFAHLGKPELETLSTLFGGTAYGWLAYRTGSVLYGAGAHAFLLSIAILTAGTIR